MNKKKSYVVWKGIKPGIYDSWKETSEQVIGVSRCEYKSYPSREEAEKAYLTRRREVLPDTRLEPNDEDQVEVISMAENVNNSILTIIL